LEIPPAGADATRTIALATSGSGFNNNSTSHAQAGKKYCPNVPPQNAFGELRTLLKSSTVKSIPTNVIRKKVIRGIVTPRMLCSDMKARDYIRP
jgi:hypothetical protein